MTHEVLPSWVQPGTEIDMKVTDKGVELGWSHVKVAKFNDKVIKLEFLPSALASEHNMVGRVIRLDLTGDATRSDRDNWNPADFRRVQPREPDPEVLALREALAATQAEMVAQRQAIADANDDAEIEALRQQLNATRAHLKDTRVQLKEQGDDLAAVQADLAADEDEKEDNSPTCDYQEPDGDKIQLKLAGGDLQYWNEGNLRFDDIDKIEVKEGKFGPRTVFLTDDEQVRETFAEDEAVYARIEALATLGGVSFDDDTQAADGNACSFLDPDGDKIELKVHDSDDGEFTNALFYYSNGKRRCMVRKIIVKPRYPKYGDRTIFFFHGEAMNKFRFTFPQDPTAFAFIEALATVAGCKFVDTTAVESDSEDDDVSSGSDSSESESDSSSDDDDEGKAAKRAKRKEKRSRKDGKRAKKAARRAAKLAAAEAEEDEEVDEEQKKANIKKQTKKNKKKLKKLEKQIGVLNIKIKNKKKKIDKVRAKKDKFEEKGKDGKVKKMKKKLNFLRGEIKKYKKKRKMVRLEKTGVKKLLRTFGVDDDDE